VAAAILDCEICKILLADGVWRAQLHHCTKFCQNWSLSCENINIFLIFQDGGHPSPWICLGHIWNTHNEYSAKFGYDRCSSFYNMNI